MKIFFKPIMTSALLSDDQELPTLDSFWYMTSQISVNFQSGKESRLCFSPEISEGGWPCHMIGSLCSKETHPTDNRGINVIFCF